MNIEAQRELRLLTEVDKDSRITQRSLAKHLGVALGLTNLYLKRLAGKRYITTSDVQGRRACYRLTPRGSAKKALLMRRSLQHSLTHYRDIRERCRRLLLEAACSGTKRVVICGTEELAEVAYLTILELGLTLVGFVGGTRERTFLSYPMGSPDTLVHWDFDTVVIADLRQARKLRAQLLACGIPVGKLVTL